VGIVPAGEGLVLAGPGSHSLVAGNLKRHRCSVAVRKAQDFVVHILDILLVAEAHHKQAVVNAYKVKLAEALVHKAIAVPEGTEIAVLEDMVTRIAGRAAALRSVDTVERLDMLGIVLDLDRSLLAVEVEHHTAEEESHRQERRPLLEVLKLDPLYRFDE